MATQRATYLRATSRDGGECVCTEGEGGIMIIVRVTLIHTYLNV